MSAVPLVSTQPAYNLRLRSTPFAQSPSDYCKTPFCIIQQTNPLQTRQATVTCLRRIASFVPPPNSLTPWAAGVTKDTPKAHDISAGAPRCDVRGGSRLLDSESKMQPGFNAVVEQGAVSLEGLVVYNTHRVGIDFASWSMITCRTVLNRGDAVYPVMRTKKIATDFVRTAMICTIQQTKVIYTRPGPSLTAETHGRILLWRRHGVRGLLIGIRRVLAQGHGRKLAQQSIERKFPFL